MSNKKIEAALRGINSNLRILERRVKENDLRVKQLMITLKLTIDKYYSRKKVRKMTMDEFVGYIDRLIKSYYQEEKEVDLFDSIVDEQTREMSLKDNIGVNPNEDKT